MRDEAITLGEGALEVELWRDPDYTPGAAGGGGEYGREIALSPRRGQATGVEVRVEGRPAARIVLLCEDGCPASRTDAPCCGTARCSWPCATTWWR